MTHHSPTHRGWYSHGYLPHVDSSSLIQHITFHLADSLPRKAIARMEQELLTMPITQRSLERRKRIQTMLDNGSGNCLLRQDPCARIVEQAFLFGDGERYRLLAWVVMPNHVHVLIEQAAGWPLGKLVQSWKRHTNREIRRLASISHDDPIWQQDYWDRFIRNERHLLIARRYVEENPVEAGLVERAE